MPSLDRWIWVSAPLAYVFSFVADYRNASRYQHQFTRFEPLPGLEYGLGATAEARGRFRGFPVRARLKIVEFVEGRRIVTRSIGGMKSSAEWDFLEEKGGTRVRLLASYEFPVPVPSRTLRKIVESEVASMTESSLRELKRLIEAEHRAILKKRQAE